MTIRTRPRERWPNDRYRKPRNTLRWRVGAFLAALIAIAAFDVPHPWGMVIGVVVYVAVVFPALRRDV